jgi:hypothetical protein
MSLKEMCQRHVIRNRPVGQMAKRQLRPCPRRGFTPTAGSVVPTTSIHSWYSDQSATVNMRIFCTFSGSYCKIHRDSGFACVFELLYTRLNQSKTLGKCILPFLFTCYHLTEIFMYQKYFIQFYQSESHVSWLSLVRRADLAVCFERSTVVAIVPPFSRR